MSKRIKEIIRYALNEITAVDQMLRLEPDSIYSPFRRAEAINIAFKATCEKYKIKYGKEDLAPEGNEQLKNMLDLIIKDKSLYNDFRKKIRKERNRR